jgi:hypothetical protein
MKVNIRIKVLFRIHNENCVEILILIFSKCLRRLQPSNPYGRAAPALTITLRKYYQNYY